MSSDEDSYYEAIGDLRDECRRLHGLLVHACLEIANVRSSSLGTDVDAIARSVLAEYGVSLRWVDMCEGFEEDTK